MNLDDASGGDIEPQRYSFESKLSQVGVTHSEPYCTPPNAGGGFFCHHCSHHTGALYYVILSYTYARASKQLIMKVDHQNTMNR
jgi:hypothetical protein